MTAETFAALCARLTAQHRLVRERRLWLAVAVLAVGSVLR